MPAAAIIDGDEPLLLTDGVLMETAYVLASVYRVPPEEVVDHLIALLRRANIDTFGIAKDVALEALLLRRPSGRVSFADAFVWAAARSEPERAVYSFDTRFPEEGIEVRRAI